MGDKSFYEVGSPDEAMKIYLESHDNLYDEIKIDVIRKVLFKTYNKDKWKSLNILEIGSAGGIWTKFFISLSARITCIDTCEPILKKNAEQNPEAKYVVGDAADVKLDEKFDFVFAKDVIEHISDDDRFLKNMHDHLNENGLILINTQNSWSLNYLLQGGYHRLKGDHQWCGWDPTHLRFYSRKTLGKKLRTSGFKVDKWFGSYYLPYRIITGRVQRKNLEKRYFHFTELLNLYDVSPISFLGWNLGVVAQKTSQ